MKPTALEHTEVRDACALDDTALAEQLAGWDALAARARDVQRSASTVRLELDPADRRAAEALVATERSCCSFLDITVDDRVDCVVVTITSPEPATDAVVSFIAKP